MAYAFVLTRSHLLEHVDADPSAWTWSNAHTNAYPHLPFSMVPVLRHFFHREVPAGGNYHTAAVSRYVLADLEKYKKFKGLYTANYKQVIDLGERGQLNSGQTLMTIDTGMSGNLFTPHYFSMNDDHVKGNLYKMSHDFEELKSNLDGNLRNYLLQIQPKNTTEEDEKLM